MKSLFNKLIIDTNITFLTWGTKGSIPGTPRLGMLYFSKIGCTLGLPSVGVLLLAKTGHINSLLIGNRKFSMIDNLKSNKALAPLETPKTNFKINPLWLTGFIDGEGCLFIQVAKNSKTKTGWVVQLRFLITLHYKDLALLESIKNYFKVGSISKQGSYTFQFRTNSVKDLTVIINHLNKYPIISQKFADYELFKEAYNLIKKKEHLTDDGLRKILAIKASINRGFSSELKSAFPDVIPMVRPVVENQKIYKDWMCGFTSAEGCFLVNLAKSKSHSQGLQVKLVFQLTQHSRDEKLIRSFIDFFQCGFVFQNREAYSFEVTKLSDINEKIIPFFQQNPIQGVKRDDFEDFCRVAEIIKDKKHLTAEGLDQIRKIKAGMNTGRQFDYRNVKRMR